MSWKQALTTPDGKEPFHHVARGVNNAGPGQVDTMVSTVFTGATATAAYARLVAHERMAVAPIVKSLAAIAFFKRYSS